MQRHGATAGPPTELPLQHRAASIVRARDGETFDLTFSSTAAVRRWYGFERLSHTAGAVNMERAEAGLMSVLDSHRQGLDAVLGTVERAWIGNDERGHAAIRFANTTRGQEARELVDTKAVRGVSVGYTVDEMREAGRDEASGETIYEAVKWTPIEISITHSPMDASVGIGRAREGETLHPVKLRSETMTESATATATRSAPGPHDPGNTPGSADTAAGERERINAMIAFGAKYPNVGGPELAARAVQRGAAIEDLRQEINRATQSAYRERETGDRRAGASAALLTPEWRDSHAVFSFQRCLIRCARAAGLSFPGPIPRELSDGPEAEISGFDGGDRFRIPGEVLRTPYGVDGYMPRGNVGGTRALLVDSTSTGINLVGTDHLSGSFVELLRNASAVLPYATVLGDLEGDIDIPRQAAATAATWLPETTDDDMDVSQPAFDQLTAAPAEIGAAVRFSRKTLIQASPDVENLIRADLAQVIGLGLDLGALNGSGVSNEPRGVLNQPGVPVVNFGAENMGGGATWAKLLEMAATVLGENAIRVDMMREASAEGLYVGNAKTWRKLAETPKVTNDGSAGFLLGENGRIGMFPFTLSNQLPSNLNKGTYSDADLSALLFGKLSDILILLWSGIDIAVDAATQRLRRLIVATAFQDANVLIRRNESFCIAKDLTTA